MRAIDLEQRSMVEQGGAALGCGATLGGLWQSVRGQINACIHAWASAALQLMYKCTESI